MLKILIVEDEPFIAQDIAGTIEELGHKCVGTADNAGAALALISSQEPELLLLDVKIKGVADGIDIARTARELNLPFIFITDLQGSETLERIKATQPWAYLSKPVNALKIRNAIEIALYKVKTEHQAKTSAAPERVLLQMHGSDSHQKVEVADFLWIKADGNDCILHAKSSDGIAKFDVHIAMGKFLEEVNSEDLIRVSRSHAVNLKRLDGLNGNMLEIGSERIKLSSTYKDDFFARIQKF